MVSDDRLRDYLLLKRNLLKCKRDVGEISIEEFERELDKVKKVSNILSLRISTAEINKPEYKECEQAYQELLENLNGSDF